MNAAGNGARLVQAYTDEVADEVGHTAQSAAELAAAFDMLMQWIEKREKPTPLPIAASCERLRDGIGANAGPCRYRPNHEPKPYNTRYARSALAH